MPELFPDMLKKPAQSDKCRQHLACVTSGRPRNVNLVSIDYGFRPRLRGRLTLRGLTLRRNPWTFGDRVSHSVCRYSCQHSHFRYLQDRSPDIPSQAYGTLRYRSVLGSQLSVVRGVRCLRRQLSMRPISLYASRHLVAVSGAL